MSEQTLYNVIGTGYNSTRRADPYLAGRLFELLSPQPRGTYVDIGCGTGNYTIAMTEKGVNFCGIEPSEKMLETARERSASVTWLAGTADAIPVSDAFFDGAIATLTIHHWSDLEKAFAEICRVLKPGARMVIFTSAPEQMEGYWLNHYFPKMLKDSIVQMPSLKAVSDAAEKAGLELIGTEKYFIKDDLQDHFLYVGKNRPQLYFEENIRAGISSFSALANVKEVFAGLAKLNIDMQSGRFEAIRQQYENGLGDYLFITLRKH